MAPSTLGRMKISGYMNEVEWDGQTLRARGTNKAAHLALMGPNDVDADDYVQADQTRGDMVKGAARAIRDTGALPDELVLDADEFTVEKFKAANALVNGNLTLRTRTGRTHQLHFRKKHNADFQALADALGGA